MAIERVFINDNMSKLTTKIDQLRSEFQFFWKHCRKFLSYFDNIRFTKYLALLDEHNYVSNNTVHPMEINVLSHDLECCILPLTDKRENIFTVSEVLFAQ